MKTVEQSIFSVRQSLITVYKIFNNVFCHILWWLFVCVFFVFVFLHFDSVTMNQNAPFYSLTGNITHPTESCSCSFPLIFSSFHHHLYNVEKWITDWLVLLIKQQYHSRQLGSRQVDVNIQWIQIGNLKTICSSIHHALNLVRKCFSIPCGCVFCLFTTSWLSSNRCPPASVWACCHWGSAALHSPAASCISQEAAASHEDGVSHQPECGHASSPSCN